MHLKKEHNRKFIRLVLGVSSFSVFLLSVSSVFNYWDYQQTFVDVGQQLSEKVTKKDFSQKIQESIEQGEFNDTERYLQVAKKYNFDIDHHYFESEIEKKDKPLNNVITQSIDFVEGFVEGKGTNLASIAGSVVADFTVLGDARDLRSEYVHYQEGKPVDELIVILSGAGIGLAVLTVSSLGAASPAKTGVSTIKYAIKSKQLTKTFQKQILTLSREIFDWSAFTRVLKQNTSVSSIRKAVKVAYHPKAIEPLKHVAGQVNNIRKLSSLSDSLFLLKYVDNTNDLLRLEKVVIKHGNETKVLFKLLGKSLIKTTKVLKKTTELLLSISSSIISGIFSLFLFISRKLV